MKDWTQEDLQLAIKDNNHFMLYLYTPMCGTCMVASKMLSVVEILKNDLKFGKMDLNYTPTVAKDYRIESVPCLLIFNEGILQEKVYRFESIPHLIDVIHHTLPTQK